LYHFSAKKIATSQTFIDGQSNQECDFAIALFHQRTIMGESIKADQRRMLFRDYMNDCG